MVLPSGTRVEPLSIRYFQKGFEMPNEPPERVEGDTLRASVEGFIHERLKPKLEEIEKKIEQESDAEKKQDLQEKRQKLLDDHQREVWLEDAARRASQIQLVTHTSKHMHPNVVCTSTISYPYCSPKRP